MIVGGGRPLTVEIIIKKNLASTRLNIILDKLTPSFFISFSCRPPCRPLLLPCRLRRRHHQIDDAIIVVLVVAHCRCRCHCPSRRRYHHQLRCGFVARRAIAIDVVVIIARRHRCRRRILSCLCPSRCQHHCRRRRPLPLSSSSPSWSTSSLVARHAVAIIVIVVFVTRRPFSVVGNTPRVSGMTYSGLDVGVHGARI